MDRKYKNTDVRKEEDKKDRAPRTEIIRSKRRRERTKAGHIRQQKE